MIDEAHINQVVRAVFAVLEPPAPPPPPAAPGLPPWCSTAKYAAARDLAPKTVRRYAALAAALQRHGGPELVAKYGREWRVSVAAFDGWVKSDGPRRAAGVLGRLH